MRNALGIKCGNVVCVATGAMYGTTTALTAVRRWMVMGMNEKTYLRIMNRLFLASETVCGDDMVFLETIGEIIREECGMDGGKDDAER